MINVVLAFMIVACFLVAVALHEFSHALAATLLGDSTPRTQGRQSLNLRAQLDPLGTLLAVILVSLAGIVTSLLIGVLFALLMRVLPVNLAYTDNGILARIPQLIMLFSTVN